MTPLETREELKAVAALAHEKGAKRIETACREGLARIDELEAALVSYRAGTVARVNAIPPARRREIARLAAARRWHKPPASAEHRGFTS